MKNDTCKRFLNSVLSQLGKSTGVKPIKQSFEGVFTYIAKTVGFSDDSGLYKDYGRARRTDGILSVGVNFAVAESTGMYSLGFSAIHETFHAAASQGLYSQYDIAAAAFDVGRRLGIVPEGVKAPMQGNSEQADTYNSRLFDQTVYAVCGKN